MKTPQWQQISKRWKSIANNSVNRQIFSAAIVVALGTTFVKLLAFIKELVVARNFGTGDDLEAFLIALVIPSFIIAVIAGSFNSALIPTYIKVREQEGQQAAQKLFSGAVVWSLGLLIAITFLVIVASPLYLPLITGGFAPQKLALTYQLLWAISPMIAITGINVVWGAVLNAGERFALVALVPVVTPMMTILFLLTTPAWGSFNLVVGMIVGQSIETIAIGAALRRQGMSLLPKWSGFDDRLKEVAGQYAPMIAGAFLMCSSDLVDRSMAAMLPSGSVAALSYGSKIISLPIIIASTALSTAVIPYFSKMVALDDWTNIRQALKHYMGLVFVVTIPLTGLIFLCSEPLVRILLERGSFTASNTHLVAQIQACLALQIPFYIAGMLLVRLISAMQNNKILMWGSAGNLFVNISLNYLFMQWLGIVGIALSTSCVYLFSFSFLLFFVLRNLKVTDDLGLTPHQKAAIEQLHQSKFEQIDRILTPLQRQIFQQIDLQRPFRYQIRQGIGLSADCKAELRAIRQEYLQRFKSILSPDQISELQQISGWEKGISTAWLKQLNLNSSQTEVTIKLHEEESELINTLLTPEQKQQVNEIQGRRQEIRTVWKRLNLTAEQRTQMRAIRQANKQQLNTILNPAQQAKIKSGDSRYKIRR
jgi:putative peptidoglycan lipid II flippase